MAARKRIKPKYRKHSTSDRGFFEYGGKRHYLPGRYNSPESLKAYRDELKKLNVRPPEPEKVHTSLADLAERFKASETDRRGSKGVRYSVGTAMKLLVAHGGDAREFTSGDLEDLLIELANQGKARQYINELRRQVIACFKWAAKRRIVTAEQWNMLKLAEPLKAFDTDAVEPRQGREVSDEDFETVVKLVTPTIADLLRFMRLTGARTKEARLMRVREIDRSEEIWSYQPSHHKTAHKGKTRTILIGHRAQAIVRPRLLRPDECFVFSPVKDGTKHYAKDTVHQAVRRACIDTGIKWYAHEQRHTAGTRAAREFGIEGAKDLMGQADTRTAEKYIHTEGELAKKVAKKLG